MMTGAHDYVMKDRLARLAPAVERELREAEVRRARRQTEMALRAAQEELELRVQERTTDLQQANLKLKGLIHEQQSLEEAAVSEDRGEKLTSLSVMIKILNSNYRLRDIRWPPMRRALAR